jgi:uncharacterized Zn finger protein
MARIICEVCGSKIHYHDLTIHKLRHEEARRKNHKREQTTVTAIPLMVKCKNCGTVHPSAIQVDETSFKTTTLTNNSENCPKCGKMSTYNKPDYFFSK